MRHITTLIVGPITLAVTENDGMLTVMIRDGEVMDTFSASIPPGTSDAQSIVAALRVVSDLGFATRDETMAAAVAADAINRARYARSLT